VDAPPPHLDGGVEDALQVGAAVLPVELVVEGLPVDVGGVDDVDDPVERGLGDVAVGERVFFTPSTRARRATSST
jgi:hypothetical protein